MRDSQRSKLYTAEDVVLRSYSDVIEKRPEMIDVLSFVKKVTTSQFTIKKFGKCTVICKDGRRRSRAGARYNPCSGMGEILMPRWARNDLIILHELAHVYTDMKKQYISTEDARKIAPHGHEFASTYLILVKHFIGADVYDELKLQFKEHRVRISPKAVREMTDERRAQLRERGLKLAAMRREKLQNEN